MQTSHDFVRELRARYPRSGTKYGLAKLLGLSPQAIDKRERNGQSFSDETGERIAELLDLEPGYVLACLAAERAKRPTVRAIWQGIADGLEQQGKKAARVAMVLLGLLILPPFMGDSDAAAGGVTVSPAREFDALYIMRTWARRLGQIARAAWRRVTGWHTWCKDLAPLHHAHG